MVFDTIRVLEICFTFKQNRLKRWLLFLYLRGHFRQTRTDLEKIFTSVLDNFP